MDQVASIALGDVTVETSINGGASAEQLAARAANKMITIGDQSPPEIRVQAHAFKERLHKLMYEYILEGMRSERDRICAELVKDGRADVAEFVRNLGERS